IERARIDFAPEYRSTAVLLAGWLAAQLDWRVQSSRSRDVLRFVDATERKIDVELREQPGEPISEINLQSSGTEFLVSHPKGKDLLEVSRGSPDERRMPQLMPAAINDVVRLMSD